MSTQKLKRTRILRLQQGRLDAVEVSPDDRVPGSGDERTDSGSVADGFEVVHESDESRLELLPPEGQDLDVELQHVLGVLDRVKAGQTCREKELIGSGGQVVASWTGGSWVRFLGTVLILSVLKNRM